MLYCCRKHLFLQTHWLGIKNCYTINRLVTFKSSLPNGGNQHQDYDCSCENKRLMEISQDVGHRNIVFIRFNPDDYIRADGNKVSSCWEQNGKGVCKIKKKKGMNCVNALVFYLTQSHIGLFIAQTK